MTQPSQENGVVRESASEWLPGGVAAPPAPEEIARPLRRSVWIPRDEPPSPESAEDFGLAVEEAPPQEEPEPEPQDFVAEEAPHEPDPEVEQLRADLRRAERRAQQAEKRADRAEERAGHLEDRAAHLEECVRELGLSAAAAQQAAPAAEPAAAPIASDEVDLNRATFEVVRALGLSVSQSARFIAQREERGGFASLDDLDALYGLPHDVIDALRQHGSV